MRHTIPLRLLALLCALSTFLGALIGSAAQQPRTFLPTVFGAPNAQTAMIYDCQCGAVSATLRADGTVLLTILDHSRGGLVVVGYDDGVTFHEFDTPLRQQLAAAPAPSFQFPGEKQGIGDTVEAWGKLVTYAPNRTVEGGRYPIWRYVYPVPLP
jgi:hypothetical protein